MPLRRRTFLTSAGGFLAVIRSTSATMPNYPVSADLVWQALAAGATLVGHLDDRLFVERYEPGGRLRGTYAGRAYRGQWRIEGDRLCTEVAPQPPLCVSVRGLTAGPMGDGKVLWLVREDGVGSILVTYRTRSPWQNQSIPMSVRVTVISSARDSFGAEGTAAGLPPRFAVWIGREVAVRAGEQVIIGGTTDGVTFMADWVTRVDGTPVP